MSRYTRHLCFETDLDFDPDLFHHPSSCRNFNALYDPTLPFYCSTRRLQRRIKKPGIELYLQSLRKRVSELKLENEWLARSKAGNGERINRTSIYHTHQCPKIPVVGVGAVSNESKDPRLSAGRTKKKAFMEQFEKISSENPTEYEKLYNDIVNLLDKVLTVEVSDRTIQTKKKDQMVKKLIEMAVTVKEEQQQQQESLQHAHENKRRSEAEKSTCNSGAFTSGAKSTPNPRASRRNPRASTSGANCTCNARAFTSNENSTYNLRASTSGAKSTPYPKTPTSGENSTRNPGASTSGAKFTNDCGTSTSRAKYTPYPEASTSGEKPTRDLGTSTSGEKPTRNLGASISGAKSTKYPGASTSSEKSKSISPTYW